MTRQLAWSVVADGGTDLLLVPLIQWAVHRLDPAVEILEPEFRKRKGSVAEFLATYRTGAMLIFAHRDAENLRLDERRREFETLERQDVVPVVPVRMSESWLLFDGPAIAKAAGAPSSQVHVPDIAQIENIPDPKDRLDELLFQAAGAPVGRRGRIFRRSHRQTPRQRGRVHLRLQSARERTGVSEFPGSARRALPVQQPPRAIDPRRRANPCHRRGPVLASAWAAWETGPAAPQMIWPVQRPAMITPAQSASDAPPATRAAGGSSCAVSHAAMPRQVQ